MKRAVLFFSAIFFSLSVFSLTGMDMPDPGTKTNSAMFTGYLSDVRCAESNNGVTSDGIDLKLHPEKHTVACMKTLPCAMSGYGLFIKGDNGSYSFYRFDKKGINLSKDLLKKTARKSGIFVHVTGELKDNIIYVESIREM